MLKQMNALYRIASELEAIDPLIAYEFDQHLRSLVSTDRSFILELLPREKNLSNQLDRVELVENRSGGWDWIHTNVDGQGTRDKTGWRLQPSEILKMIDSSVEPGPMTDEVKALLEQEMSGGNPGVPRGSEMIGEPTALPDVDMTETPSAVEENSHPWDRGFSLSDHGLASQKLVKKAIHVAYSRPDLRSSILPILRKIIKHNSH
jgi:hypothetical protein